MTKTQLDISTRLTDRLHESMQDDQRLSRLLSAVAYRREGEKIEISVSNRFTCDLIRRHYTSLIEEAVRMEFGDDVGLRLCVGGTMTPSPREDEGSSLPQNRLAGPEVSPESPGTQRHGRTSTESSVRLRHRLDEFIVGPSNELAYATASRLVESTPHDQSGSMQLLFVHGGCGLGKTHLLQGVCRRFAETHPGKQWRYTTAEQFTNEYIQAIRQNAVGQFRRKMRKLDLLAVDDVHFLSSKNATQQEYLLTLDAIGLHGSKVIMASDNHPKLIEAFSEALVSRFLSGMVVKIDQPGVAMRRELIQRLAAMRGMVLIDSVIDQLAERAIGSIREIEGMLTKLSAVASLTGESDQPGQPIGHAIADRMFGETTAYVKRPVRFQEIFDEVITTFHVERAEVMSKSRHRRVVFARTVIIHLARQLTTMSYPEIAKAMGRPNHSTIVTAAQRMSRQIEEGAIVEFPPNIASTTIGNLTDRLHRQIISAAQRS